MFNIHEKYLITSQCWIFCQLALLLVLGAFKAGQLVGCYVSLSLWRLMSRLVNLVTTFYRHLYTTETTGL